MAASRHKSRLVAHRHCGRRARASGNTKSQWRPSSETLEPPRKVAHLEWALAEWRQSGLQEDLQEHCYFQLPAFRPAVGQCSWPRWVRASSSATAAPSPEGYLPRTRWCGVHCLTARPYSISLVGADCCLDVVPEQPVRLLGPELIRNLAPALVPTACLHGLAERRAKLVRATAAHGKLSRHRRCSNPHSGKASPAWQPPCYH